MNPKAKAKELLENFSIFKVGLAVVHLSNIEAKVCALMTVEEIIRSEPTKPRKYFLEEPSSISIDETLKYWQDVRDFLNAL